MSLASRFSFLFLSALLASLGHAAEVEFKGFPQKVFYVEDGKSSEKNLSPRQAVEA